MENKNWSDFNNTIEENLNTIKRLFSNNDLVLGDNKVEIEKNDAKENQKEFDDWKKKLMGVIEVKETQQFDTLLSDNRKLLEKREKIVERLNQTIEGLKSKYKNEKQSCEKACGAIDSLIEDKEGWLDIMAEAIRIQHNDNEVTKEKQKEVVKKKKGEIDCQYGCTIVGSCILFACCLAVQVFLFEIMGLEEASWHAEEIGIYIAVVAMIVCLVCEVFLVRGIVRLSKKKNYILQRLDLILNKIDMRKVTKFEIDRDLEKVLEEMK
jgi:hypothetical protein